MKFEDLAKPNSFLNGPKLFFELLHSVFSKDVIVLEEDEVVHNNLEITSNPVIVEKTVIVWDRYSSWQNLVRKIAYIKLVRNWKIKKKRDHFSVEHHNLKSQTPISKRIKILPLAPIIVNNLIKVGGRIRHAKIPDQQKHQTILPAAYHVKSLIVIHFHEKYHHCGRDQTLASIREEF